MKKKEDRRVRYTKMVLRESLIEILMEQEISSVTITQICERADINRATFYSHYSDQYDLLSQIAEEFLEDIGFFIVQFKIEKPGVEQIVLLEKIFDFLRENAKLCKILLSQKGNLDYQKRIIMLIYDKELLLFQESRKKREETEYLYSFVLTGSVGIIQKWLDDGMDKSSSFMAEVIFSATKFIPLSYT